MSPLTEPGKLAETLVNRVSQRQTLNCGRGLLFHWQSLSKRSTTSPSLRDSHSVETHWMESDFTQVPGTDRIATPGRAVLGVGSGYSETGSGLSRMSSGSHCWRVSVAKQAIKSRSSVMRVYRFQDGCNFSWPIGTMGTPPPPPALSKFGSDRVLLEMLDARTGPLHVRCRQPPLCSRVLATFLKQLSAEDLVSRRVLRID